MSSSAIIRRSSLDRCKPSASGAPGFSGLAPHVTGEPPAYRMESRTTAMTAQRHGTQLSLGSSAQPPLQLVVVLELKPGGHTVSMSQGHGTQHSLGSSAQPPLQLLVVLELKPGGHAVSMSQGHGTQLSLGSSLQPLLQLVVVLELKPGGHAVSMSQGHGGGGGIHSGIRR